MTTRKLRAAAWVLAASAFALALFAAAVPNALMWAGVSAATLTAIASTAFLFSSPDHESTLIP